MHDSLEKFIKKHSIDKLNIKYILRKEKKTCLYLTNGDIVQTYIPLKEFISYFGCDDFLHIGKGIYIATHQIISIERDTYYTLDGMEFQGRKNHAKEHRDNKARLCKNLANQQEFISSSADLIQRLSILDNMPMAFCVIELRFDSQNHAIDFIFRYCNKAMEILENHSISEMLNQSFFKVFTNADPKWLITYAQIAIYGGSKTICDYSPEINKNLKITCFQTGYGYCGCLLETLDDHLS